MKKKLLNIIYFFLPLSPLYLQEYEIKYDISHLESIESSKKSTNTNLTAEEFKENIKTLKNVFSVPILANNITFQYTKNYLSKKWVAKVIGLSDYYFPLFEEKLKQYEIPNELKYLAIVESALNPRAGSPAGASGLWQFMPETGENFGLKNNEYINIFYDPIANTDCAMRFLKELYERYNDWFLAISAYNCGAGNVNKAIKKAGTNEYWKIRPFLPKETQAYVPTFLAVCYVFNFYDYHGIEPPVFKYKFSDFKMVKLDKDVYLKEIVILYNTPENVFRFANPQLLTDYIPKGSIVYVFNF